MSTFIYFHLTIFFNTVFTKICHRRNSNNGDIVLDGVLSKSILFVEGPKYSNVLSNTVLTLYTTFKYKLKFTFPSPLLLNCNITCWIFGFDWPISFALRWRERKAYWDFVDFNLSNMIEQKRKAQDLALIAASPVKRSRHEMVAAARAGSLVSVVRTMLLN